MAVLLLPPASIVLDNKQTALILVDQKLEGLGYPSAVPTMRPLRFEDVAMRNLMFDQQAMNFYSTLSPYAFGAEVKQSRLIAKLSPLCLDQS